MSARTYGLLIAVPLAHAETADQIMIGCGYPVGTFGGVVAAVHIDGPATHTVAHIAAASRDLVSALSTQLSDVRDVLLMIDPAIEIEHPSAEQILAELGLYEVAQ